MEGLKTSLLEEKEARRTLQTEADSNRSQFLDIQRAERVVRVDLEETKRAVSCLCLMLVHMRISAVRCLCSDASGHADKGCEVFV